MIDLSTFAGNNKKNIVNATTGTIGFTLPGGNGAMVSGEDYKIGTVPANSIITGVSVIVGTAFTGTTPIADITVGTLLVDDAALGVIGITTTEVDTFNITAQDIMFKPTLSSATAGDVRIVVSFIEVDRYSSTFTA